MLIDLVNEIPGCFQDALYLDVETTGVSNRDEIIEVGIVDFDGQPIYDCLIKPSVNIHPKAYEVHGIGYEILSDAADFHAVQAVLYEILNDKTVIAFNANFDKRMVEQTFSKFGYQIPNAKWGCMMLTCNNIFGGQGSLKDYCVKFGIDPGTHRALNDALALVELAKKL